MVEGVGEHKVVRKAEGMAPWDKGCNLRSRWHPCYFKPGYEAARAEVIGS